MHTYRKSGESFDILFCAPTGADIITVVPTEEDAHALVSYLNGGLHPRLTEDLQEFLKEFVVISQQL